MKQTKEKVFCAFHGEKLPCAKCDRKKLKKSELIAIIEDLEAKLRQEEVKDKE